MQIYDYSFSLHHVIYEIQYIVQFSQESKTSTVKNTLISTLCGRVSLNVPLLPYLCKNTLHFRM